MPLTTVSISEIAKIPRKTNKKRQRDNDPDA
jgi:hypothetical protein